jgi:hypothetical protein
VARPRRLINEPADGCLWHKVLGENSFPKEGNVPFPATITDRRLFKHSSE